MPEKLAALPEHPGISGHELNPGSFARDWIRANESDGLFLHSFAGENWLARFSAICYFQQLLVMYR
jgi:hypothetical protein